MERKFPLIVALAVAGAIVPTGVVSADTGDLLNNTTSGLNDTLNNTTSGLNDTLNNTTKGLNDTLNNATGGGGGGSQLPGGGSTTSPLPSSPTPTSPTGGGGSTSGGTSGGGSHGGVGPAGPGGSGGHRSRRGNGGPGSGGQGPGSVPQAPLHHPNGVPTRSNPTLTVADVGPAPLGVPSFLIDQFTIPPFLLPIYQACGTQYGIPWEVLAGINRIETAFGTNLNVSSAGAIGWMQFIPSTWRTYGVDANGDGRADPYNPVDAICAAARYLKAAGGDTDLRRGIFAYNHADWYVDEVLLYARQYGRLPPDLLGSLTGLTQGDRFPVAAKARYADDLSERQAARNAKPTNGAHGNVADVVSSSPTRRGINIYSYDGAPVVAVNDGKIKRLGRSKQLGNYVVLQDDYGNRFTYAELGHLTKGYPVPKQHRLSGHDLKLVTTKSQSPEAPRRLYAFPGRSHNVVQAELTGQLESLLPVMDGTNKDPMPGGGQKAMELRPLRKGSRVSAGTVLGRIGKTDNLAPHVNFAIQPAGRGAPKIDPKPILDGWKLLEATAIYRAAGENPFTQSAGTSNIAQDLLMPRSAVERKVLADPRLTIYQCGRDDIRTGQIDRRVLATMEYLTDNGLRLGIGALKCGHSQLRFPAKTSSRAEHAAGDAMSVGTINGVSLAGRKGSRSLARELVKSVLNLQGTMEPSEVVSSEDLPGPISFSTPDARDFVDIGFAPLSGAGYQNPFVDAVEGRIDMGVDFTGTGPILAIGTARILQIGAPGWPNGGAGPAGQGVLYRLLAGPQAGRIIFVYEGLTPKVKPGQMVVAGQQIATFYPGSSIEIGFADAAGQPLSHAIYTEGMVTPWGRRMYAFLHSVGVPGKAKLNQRFSHLLEPGQWNRVIKRLGQIRNPNVPTSPSRYSTPAGERSHGSAGGH